MSAYSLCEQFLLFSLFIVILLLMICRTFYKGDHYTTLSRTCRYSRKEVISVLNFYLVLIRFNKKIIRRVWHMTAFFNFAAIALFFSNRNDFNQVIKKFLISNTYNLTESKSSVCRRSFTNKLHFI